MKPDCAGAGQVLLSGLGSDAQRPDGGGVPATVHVLVHLLGHLLGVAEVRGGDGDSAEEEESSDTKDSPTSQLKIQGLLTASSPRCCGP